MPRALVHCLLFLAFLVSSSTAAAQAPTLDTYAPSIAAATASTQAGTEGQSPLLSSTRRLRPIPTLVPRLKLTVERTAFFREEYLSLAKFWDGRLRIDCFRYRPRARFFTVPPPFSLQPQQTAATMYGLRLAVHFGLLFGAE